MKRIIVVDDEQSIVDFLCVVIKGMGYIPVPFNSAESALDYYMKNPVNVVLTDLLLAEGHMQGVSLCSKIKWENPSTYVIAITGHIYDFDLAYCLGVGFDDVLRKPVRHEVLNESISCAFKISLRWNTSKPVLYESGRSGGNA